MPPRRNNSLSDATGAPHYVDEAWAILVGEKTECSLCVIGLLCLLGWATDILARGSSALLLARGY